GEGAEGGGEQERAGGMAAPPKAWKAEYAKSGRASCKSCRSPIAKDQLRLGKMVQATQFDGFMPTMQSKDYKRNKPTKGSKRKKGENDMQSCKAPKLDESTSEGTVRNKGKLVDPRDSNASSADIQQKLKEQ
uniref:PARP-type domain-containing protein n=1 Tax=Setaria italica TaxID=4555 RepID=K4A0T6_SETIT